MTVAWLFIVAGAILTCGLTALVYAVRKAPLGYQDEHGFHLGSKRSAPLDERGLENPS